MEHRAWNYTTIFLKTLVGGLVDTCVWVGVGVGITGDTTVLFFT